MNINFKNENPIEMLRIKLNMTQNEFAAALKYDNVAMYAYHKNVFSEDIRVRIKEIYSVDLTSEIIAYLLCKIRSLRPKKEARKGSTRDRDNASPAQLSDLIKRMGGEV